MWAKWTEVNGVACQGKTEARMAQVLFDIGYTPKRGIAVDTPLGKYTPDFDCGDFYVEVKAINSWLHAHGIVPLIENARDPKLANKTDAQHRKMLYVNENVKPVLVLVDMTSSKKAYRDIPLPETPLSVIIGTSDYIMEQLSDSYQFNPPRASN
jgi:hypothetical protein